MENRKHIKFMQAACDGVIFFADSGVKGCSAHLNKDGSIESESFLVANPPYFPSTFINKQEIEYGFSYLNVAVFDIWLIFFAAYMKSADLFVFATLFSLGVSLNLFKLLNIIFHMKVSSHSKSTAKFVAASHMVTNAYLKFQRIPTLEESKKFSRFSADSRVIWSFYEVLIGISITLIWFLFSEINVFIRMSFCLALAIIIILLLVSGALNFLQTFVTSKPSDTEIKVAIEALKCYENLENEIKE